MDTLRMEIMCMAGMHTLRGQGGKPISSAGTWYMVHVHVGKTSAVHAVHIFGGH